MGLGVVIRNARGEQMASYCEEFPSAKDGLHLAANAMLKALQFGVDVGFYCLMVEFSHSQLKALIQSTEECLLDIGDQIAHIRNFRTKFSHLGFIVIPGSCNCVAKMLADFAKGNTEPSIWLKALCFSFQLFMTPQNCCENFVSIYQILSAINV